MKPVNQLAKAVQLTERTFLSDHRGQVMVAVAAAVWSWREVCGGRRPSPRADTRWQCFRPRVRLTITDADVPGLAVTARGRTPSAARVLATDAAEALCSMFEEANAMTSGGFTFTVVPPGN